MSGIAKGERLYPGLNLRRDDPDHGSAEESVFGFWVFLMSDLVLFALLFATYLTMLGGGQAAPDPTTFSTSIARPSRRRCCC